MLIKLAKRFFVAEHVHVGVDVHVEAERGGAGKSACTEEGGVGVCTLMEHSKARARRMRRREDWAGARERSIAKRVHGGEGGRCGRVHVKGT